MGTGLPQGFAHELTCLSLGLPRSWSPQAEDFYMKLVQCLRRGRKTLKAVPISHRRVQGILTRVWVLSQARSGKQGRPAASAQIGPRTWQWVPGGGNGARQESLGRCRAGSWALSSGVCGTQGGRGALSPRLQGHCTEQLPRQTAQYPREVT